MTKAEGFYNRYIGGDDEALGDAIEEAVTAYIGDDAPPDLPVADFLAALANHESLKLVFSDASALELVPLAREGVFIGWSEKQFDLVE